MKRFFSTMTYRQACSMLAVSAILLTCCSLPFSQLESGDETRVAGIAAEMAVEHNYLLPLLNGKPFLEYPPFYYWCAAFCFKLSGFHDSAAKLPSVLSAIGAAFLLLLFAKRFRLPPFLCFFAGFIYLTSAQVFGSCRTCMVDMMLACFILLAVWGFHGFDTETDKPLFRVRLPLLLAGMAGMYCAVMTKGLLGFGIPAAVLGTWLLVRDIVMKKWHWESWLAAFLGSLIVTACVGLWYYLIWLRYGPDLLNTVLVVNNTGRFSGSQGDHVEPFYYYLKKMPGLFQPWLTVLFYAVFRAVRSLKNFRTDYTPAFLLIFLMIPLILFHFAMAKRVVYLMPLYAPAALLCVWSFAQPCPQVLMPLWNYLRRYDKAAAWLIPGLVLVLILVESGLAVRRNQYSLRPMFDRVKELQRAGYRIELAGVPERTRGAAFFYLQQRVAVTGNKPEDAAAPRTVRVLRSRKKLNVAAEPYGDSHYLRIID